MGEGRGEKGWVGRRSRLSEVAGSCAASFTHPKLLQKHAGRDFSASMHLHTPDFKSVQFLSRQQQSGPLRVSLASSPRRHEGEDSDMLRSGPSRMSQVTKDMATRMLHMTHFLRKKGPIMVWSVSPPLPQHFNRHKEKIFSSRVWSNPVTKLPSAC